MEIIIACIVFSILVGIYAHSKGRSGFGMFAVSILVSPLIGFFITFILVDKKYKNPMLVDAYDLRICPYCDELVKKEAKICRYCQKELTPVETTDPNSYNMLEKAIAELDKNDDK